MQYIGKILDRYDFNFPITDKLKIIVGENGTGKSLALKKLNEYFLNQKENVLYFPEDRIFSINPNIASDIISSYFLFDALNNKDPYKKCCFNKRYIDYDLNHLNEYHNRYIESGIIQWINFFSNIMVNIDKKVIVIIDTPEMHLDMHVQSTLIKQILELSNVKQLIVCTHSPEIISEYWNSVVNIKEYVNLYGE